MLRWLVQQGPAVGDEEAMDGALYGSDCEVDDVRLMARDVAW